MKNPYRLQPVIRPTLYDLSLSPDLDAFTFTGEETIVFDLLTNTRTLTFHAADLRVSTAVLFHGSTRHQLARAVKITYREKLETVTFTFDETLKKGKNYQLRLSYEGELNDKMHGFYRTSYLVNGQKRWGAATQFEATDARRAFVCVDEPAAKARFRASLTVPTHLTALSNMPVEKESADPRTGMKTLRYAVSPVMSTYLLCFVVAELEEVEARDKRGVLIRVWTTPGKKNQGLFALDVAAHALDYFAKWFGIRYALPKLDMVALPDFASGAMENWGLVTYRETALLVDPANSSASAKQRVAEVIDHELAHQWFGNLVTMEWWTDLWLNEGFASYMGPKAVDDRFPEWKLWDQYVSAELLTALHDDALRNSHPIEIEVMNPHEIREIFDHITYNKGSAVNRMLEHYLGEKAFREGLRKYLKKYSYGNARTVDLWKSLEEVSRQPVRSIMAGFTRQEGFPVIDVREERTAKGAQLVLSQRRFIFDGGKDTKKLSWSVPLTVRESARNETRSFLLKGNSARMPLKAVSGAGWIKVNPEQTGFYRVRYSKDLLERLLSAAERGELGVADTLGLLDDIFSFVRSGDLRAVEVLSILPRFSGWKEYNGWATLCGILGSVEALLEKDEDRARLHLFGRQLLKDVWERTGWDAKKDDAHSDILLRSLIIGRLGHFAHPEVTESAKSRFARHASGLDLDPNLRGAVYAVAAEHGAGETWKHLKALYEKTTLQEEKVRLLRAMTRLRGKDEIAEVLDYALAGQVRPQDTYVILAGFGGNTAARRQAWDFIRLKWESIAALYKSGSVGLLGHILEGATSGFSEAADLKEVQTFFAAHPVPGTERMRKQVLELIRSNIEWKKRDADAVAKWLTDPSRSAGNFAKIGTDSRRSS